MESVIAKIEDWFSKNRRMAEINNLTQADGLTKPPRCSVQTRQFTVNARQS